MIEWNKVQKLMECFPRSFINQSGEFIAHLKANEYFRLDNCESELDVKCKVLEWFSQGAYKRQPYGTKKSNDEFNKFMRDGINEYLGTDFNETDMEIIYTYLGNCCNHKLTIKFIESGYDMSVLIPQPYKKEGAENG